MTNKEVQNMKKYLKSYRALQREVRLQRIRLSDLQRAIRLPGLHMYLGDPAELQTKAERQQKKILDGIAYAQERCREIEALIDRTEGPSEHKTWIYRQILRLRYLDGLPMLEIPPQLGYNERHTRRLHREALEAVVETYGKGVDKDEME